MRYLAWDACYNTRDLGGLPTEDGCSTRWRSVIRSDVLGRLTERGRRALLDYGVQTIVDLRSPQECEAQPSFGAALVYDLPAPTYFNLPIEKYYPHVSKKISKAANRAEIYCIILDHYPDAVAAIMRAIADAVPGGVVIHCHGGMDRTGIVAAMLLRLAGVPLATIGEDYAESRVRLWPLYEQRVAAAGGEDLVDPWLKPMAMPEMILRTLDHIEAQYGGVRAYLTAAGLAPDQIERLRDRLRSL